METILGHGLKDTYKAIVVGDGGGDGGLCT